MVYRYLIYRLKLLYQQISQNFSPELKEIISDISNIKIKNNEIFKIIGYKRRLLSNSSKILYTELGAGSRRINVKRIKIRDIARYSGSGKKMGILLFKLVKYFKPEMIIELGTSLGLSTLYMARANSKCPVITIDGNQSVLDMAKKEAESQGFKNIQFIHSDFNDVFDDILIQNKNKILFIFIDGNHTYDSTIKYFKFCMKHISDESVLLIDDINWSKDMKRAWHEIKSYERIKYSIDFYYSGLLKFGKDTENKHYITSMY